MPQATNDSFEEHGFGPFVVERKQFIGEIIAAATPKKSIHIMVAEEQGKQQC